MGFFRRIGGAVRSLLTDSISASRCRHVARKTSKAAAAPRGRVMPPRPEPLPKPARTSWLARWFSFKQPHGEPKSPRQRPRDVRAANPFTPEAFPGLSREAYAFFNTPVGQCDPEMLRVVLFAFSRNLARRLPPELQGTDADALFAKIWDRLSPALDAAAPDRSPPGQPSPTPDASNDAGTDATQAPTVEMPPPATAHVAAETPVTQAGPDAVALAASVVLDIHPPSGGRRQIRPRRQSWTFCGPLFANRRVPRFFHRPPPTRRLTYAACAGPP